jgi:hypothetical protein
MATDAEVQTQLDDDRFGRGVRLTRTVRVSSAIDSRYVVPVVSRAGRARWVNTNVASSASAQAASILTQVGV